MKKLSSTSQQVATFVFLIWSLVLGIVMITMAFSTGGIGDGIVCCVFASSFNAFVISEAVRFKTVHLVRDGLLVRDPFRSAHIPFEAIRSVRECKRNRTHYVRIELTTPGVFGARIAFLPIHGDAARWIRDRVPGHVVSAPLGPLAMKMPEEPIPSARVVKR